MKNTIVNNNQTQWIGSTAEWRGRRKESVNLKIRQ